MRSSPSVMGRLRAISSITATSSPLSRATRRVKLSRKSISPRMALSVMARTSSPAPARSASSSITSVSMSVESMSKQIRRRLRRQMSSFWNETSSPSSDRFMKRSCMALRLSSVSEPRTESSMQALAARSSSCSGMRPVRRLMASMFSPCSATAAVASAMWRAETVRPSSVMMQRFLPWRPTQASQSSSEMGVKRIITPSSEALNSSSFMMLPDLSGVVMIRMPKVSDWWMLAWPMSRMQASQRARMAVSDEVMPGLSAPEMLICMISMSFCMVSCVRTILFIQRQQSSFLLQQIIRSFLRRGGRLFPYSADFAYFCVQT